MPRILITGSRTWTDEGVVDRALRDAWRALRDQGPVVLVVGACPQGADEIAERIWRSRGAGEVERHPADWDRDGRGAGFKRNQKMVDLGADLCLAFAAPCVKPGCARGEPGHPSHGTQHTIDAARKAGIPVRVYIERDDACRYDGWDQERGWTVDWPGIEGSVMLCLTHGFPAAPEAYDDDQTTARCQWWEG